MYRFLPLYVKGESNHGGRNWNVDATYFQMFFTFNKQQTKSNVWLALKEKASNWSNVMDMMPPWTAQLLKDFGIYKTVDLLTLWKTQ